MMLRYQITPSLYAGIDLVAGWQARTVGENWVPVHLLSGEMCEKPRNGIKQLTMPIKENLMEFSQAVDKRIFELTIEAVKDNARETKAVGEQSIQQANKLAVQGLKQTRHAAWLESLAKLAEMTGDLSVPNKQFGNNWVNNTFTAFVLSLSIKDGQLRAHDENDTSIYATYNIATKTGLQKGSASVHTDAYDWALSMIHKFR